MPDRTISVHDLVRGLITFEADNVLDYVIVRANGEPLYPLVNPVDDALMGITHVLRGEDLLPVDSSADRAVRGAARDRRGRRATAAVRPPAVRHGGGQPQAVQARSPVVAAALPGPWLLPEGLLNYLALLGWSIGDDREIFTLEEMVAAFDVTRVNPNPARFDPKKCRGDQRRVAAPPASRRVRRRLVPFLQSAGVLPPSPSRTS